MAIKYICHPWLYYRLKAEFPEIADSLIAAPSMVIQYRRHRKKRIDKKWRKYTKPSDKVMMVSTEDICFNNLNVKTEDSK